MSLYERMFYAEVDDCDPNAITIAQDKKPGLAQGEKYIKEFSSHRLI